MNRHEAITAAIQQRPEFPEITEFLASRYAASLIHNESWDGITTKYDNWLSDEQIVALIEVLGNTEYEGVEK